MKEKSLSEKIVKAWTQSGGLGRHFDMFLEEDVAEAVKELKEDIGNFIFETKGTYEECKKIEKDMHEFIDEIFGEKLINSEENL